MESGYIVAFTTGFLGGFGHCIGMCGPLVTSYTLYDSSSANRYSTILPHIFYNTGRITTYAFIGAVMGLAGSFVNVAGRISGFQNSVAIIAGLIMIYMGFSISGIFGNTSWLEKHGRFILNAAKWFSQEKTVWRYYPLGALLGFLPCGLSYSVFMAAAGTGSIASGFLMALSFGIGTVPALLLFGVTASFISSRVKGFMYRAAGIIIALMGIWFIVKGIQLYA